MTRFERALNLVLEFEGGYANHPNDPGGETYKGIARRFWPREAIWAIIDSYKGQNLPLGFEGTLEKDEKLQKLVRQFYLDKFWLAVRADELPEPLGEYTFDFAVNVGVVTATRAMQRAINVKDDGIIGPVTLQAAKEANMATAMLRMYRERVRFYIHLVSRRPRMGVFLLGWLNRTENVYTRLTAPAGA